MTVDQIIAWSIYMLRRYSDMMNALQYNIHLSQVSYRVPHVCSGVIIFGHAV